jgi:dsRNA-specific ribonuclease
MATVSDAQCVERIIFYTFKDQRLLQDALTAADRYNDESTGKEVAFDGNRKLALLGESLIKLLALDILFERGTERGKFGGEAVHASTLKTS